MRRVMAVAGLLWMCVGQAPPAARPLVLVTPLPEEARVEQIVGHDVVAKWDEVQINARVVRMDPAAMKHATWEIRTADEKRRVAVLSIPWAIGSGEAAVDGQDRDVHLEAEQVKELAPEGDGSFVGAWVIEGERRSNVVKLVVDGKHRLTEEPLVRMTVAETTAAGRMPLCAVTVVRRAEKDPAPTLIDLLEASMEVDGKPAPYRGGIAFGGANRAMTVGNVATRMMPLDRFGVRADRMPKTVVAVVLQEKSTAVELSTKTPLGDAWDAATAGLEKAAGTQPGVAK